jgi:hypothetical protein
MSVRDLHKYWKLTGNEFSQNPCFDGGQWMMVQMQPGNLWLLFPEYKENSVSKFW